LELNLEYGIGQKGIKWGHQMGLNAFSGGKNHTVGARDKKKFSFQKIREMNAQSHLLGCMDFAQMALALAQEIKEMKDEGAQQNKFELLEGELEILYMESFNTFKKNFNLNKMPSLTIESVKERTKGWSVSVIDENTETKKEETGQTPLH
jgi:hypothetical protein